METQTKQKKVPPQAEAEASKSIAEHGEALEPYGDLGDWLPADVIRVPHFPMSTFIHEALCLVKKAREEEDGLREAGLPASFVGVLEQAVMALQSSQIIYEIERRTRRSADTERILQKAREVREDAAAACGLALRRDPDGLAKLAAVAKKGQSPAEVISALAVLAVIVIASRDKLGELGIGADELARQVGRCKAELEEASTADRASRALSLTKETRDRSFTVVADLVRDLRAFARYAFRRDPSDRRRAAFGSEYVRSRSRARRAAKATIDLLGPGSVEASVGRSV